MEAQPPPPFSVSYVSPVWHHCCEITAVLCSLFLQMWKPKVAFHGPVPHFISVFPLLSPKPVHMWCVDCRSCLGSPSQMLLPNPRQVLPGPHLQLIESSWSTKVWFTASRRQGLVAAGLRQEKEVVYHLVCISLAIVYPIYAACTIISNHWQRALWYLAWFGESASERANYMQELLHSSPSQTFSVLVTQWNEKS